MENLLKRFMILVIKNLYYVNPGKYTEEAIEFCQEVENSIAKS